MAADPLRETAVLLLMRTLAAAAQAPAALQVGRDFRHRLIEETGLDPSPALGELERDIASGSADRSGRRPGPDNSRCAAAGAAGRSRDVHPADRQGQREAALHRLLAEQRMVTSSDRGVSASPSGARSSGRRATSTVLLLAPVTDPRRSRTHWPRP